MVTGVPLSPHHALFLRSLRPSCSNNPCCRNPPPGSKQIYLYTRTDARNNIGQGEGEDQHRNISYVVSSLQHFVETHRNLIIREVLLRKKRVRRECPTRPNIANAYEYILLRNRLGISLSSSYFTIAVRLCNCRVTSARFIRANLLRSETAGVYWIIARVCVCSYVSLT